MATTWTGQATVITGVADYRWSNPLNWSDGIPDLGEDVLFPAIPNGLAKPNAIIDANGALVFPANSIIDRDFSINDLRIEGDNYHFDSLATPTTLTMSGRLLVNFAGPVGTVTGMSVFGPFLTQANPTSNLRIALNDNVTTVQGFGPANQFLNSNTGELYVTATLIDGPGRASGLIKNGTGSITLAGANTYTGVTSIQGGILVAANDGAFGSSVAATLVSDGATAGVAGGTIGDAIQIIGAGAGGQGALRGMTNSLNVFANTVPFGGGTWVGGIALIGSATIGADNALTDLAVDVRGISGTGTLTKVGAGDLGISIDSSFAGNALITQGSVSIFSDGALSPNPAFKTVVSSEATLNVDGGLDVNENLELTGDGNNRFNDTFNRPAGALSMFTQGGSATWSGSITLIATAGVNGASIGAATGGSLVLAGQLIGAASNNNTLTKVDRGRVRIARANTGFLGRTVIDNGTLEIADAKAVGNGAITVNSTAAATPAAGTLQIEGTNIALTQSITVNGPGDSASGAIHVVAPAGSGALGASTITLAGGVVINSSASVNVDTRSTLNITGVVSDTAQTPAAEFTKLGDGTLVLAGANTYTGQTVLRAGVTSVTSARGLGSTASGTTINTGAILSLDGGAAGLTVMGEALSIAGSNGTASTFRAGTGVNIWAGPVNFLDNLGAPVNIAALAGATLNLTGSLGGTAAVHKVGDGTVALRGTGGNTNSGTIFVDAGTLALGNSSGVATSGSIVVGDGVGAGSDTLLLLAANQLDDSRPVTVNSTGVFNLNGLNETIGGGVALTLAGGSVQTGAGTLTLNGDVNTFGTVGSSNVSGNIFLTSTRTFLFLPAPEMTITSSVNSSQFDSPVTFTVTAFPFGSEGDVTGSVTFFDGDTRIGSVQSFAPNGIGRQTTASVTTSALTGGLHTIRAVYSGSNLYGSTTIVMNQQQAVRNVPAFTTLVSDNITAEPGQNVTFTYRMTQPAGSIAPTGTVTFFDNGVPIGAAVTLTTDGFAAVSKVFATPTTAAERFHTITATYSGDLFFSSNTVVLSAPKDLNSPFSRPVSQQVGFDPTVKLTTNADAVAGDRAATINFNVSGPNGVLTPTGTVQFYLDGASLGTPVTVDANGNAVFTFGTDISPISNATWSAANGGTAVITTLAPHHLETGNTVTITGPATGYNGTFVVTRISSSQFSYSLAVTPPAFVPPTANGAVILNATWSGGIATITTNGSNFTTGSLVTIAGLTPAGYNGTYQVTADRLIPSRFTFALASNPGTFVSEGVRRVGIDVSNATWSNVGGGTAVITTGAAHNLNTGDTVTISGLNPAAYNGTFVVTRIDANRFGYSLVRGTDPGARVNGGSVFRTGAGISNAVWANGVVTVTTTGSHNLETGDVVTLTGITRAGYNGTFSVTRIDATHFQYDLTTDPGYFVNGLANALPTVNVGITGMEWDDEVVTVTTATPHGLRNGDVVTIDTNRTSTAVGDPVPSAPNGFDGTFVVTVVDDTHFRYTLQLHPGIFVGTASPPSVRNTANLGISNVTWANGEATFTTTLPHNLAPGSAVTIRGIQPLGYNGNYTVTLIDNGTQFRVAIPVNPGAFVPPTAVNQATMASLGITNATWAGNTATITTAAPHGLVVGNTVNITGVASNLNANAFNGTFVVTSIIGGPGSTQFTYTLLVNPGAFVPASAQATTNTQIQNMVWNNGVVTVTTTVPTNLVNGQQVTIVGALPPAYNGTYTITLISPTQFSYMLANDPGPFFTGTSTGTVTRSGLAIGTVPTVTPTTLDVGEHEVTAEFRSSDKTFTDAVAHLSIDNLESNTPVVYQMLTSRSAVQISTPFGDPRINDPASFTFRVNSNDNVNYQAAGNVGDPFHPTPEGSVLFEDPRRNLINGNPLAVVPIGMIGVMDDDGNIRLFSGVPGEATLIGVTFPVGLFGVGTTTITGTYSGDTYYAGATQNVTLGLLETNTAVKLSTNHTSVAVGEQVEFTVDASTLAAMNVPTTGRGTVVLTATNTTTGQVLQTIFTVGTGDRPGVGAGSLRFTVPGVYSVQAEFNAVTDAIGSETVTLNPNITVVAPFDGVVTSNLVPSAPVGTSVTFTFRSTASASASVRPSGTIEFFDGLNKIGTTQPLAADGTASVTLDSDVLGIGSHTIRAVFTPSTGSPYQITQVFMDEPQVVGTPPRLDINTSTSTAVDGEAVTIRVTTVGSVTTPTGRVDLFANGVQIASGVLVRNGVATYTVPAIDLPAGRYTITAQYSGDIRYAATTATMVQDLVVISPARLQLRSSANANVNNGSTISYPVAAGQTVTYTAELRTNSTAPIAQTPVATGSVTFNLLDANGVVVATTGPQPLTTVVVVVDATTTLKTPTAVGTLTAPAGVGNYRVQAVYAPAGVENFQTFDPIRNETVVLNDANYSPLTATIDQPVVATAAELPAAAPAATRVDRLVPTLNVNASIGGGAGTGIVSQASGTLVLNGTSTYGGPTLITGAGNTVKLGVNNAIPDNSAVTITDGTLDVNGRTDTVGTLDGNGTLNLNGGTFATGLTGSSTFTGPITGAGVLQKVGAGSLTLTATSLGYTGTTVISSGTVFVDGDQRNAAVTVGSGGVLGGSGTVGAVTVGTGGQLAPGASPGILRSTGNLALGAGSSFVVEVNGTTAGTDYDRFATTGAANINGSTLVFNLGYTPAISDTFTILTATNQVTGTFAGLDDLDTFVLNNRVFQIDYQANSVVVTMIAFASTATITSGTNPSSPAQPVTFTVTIAPALTTDPTPLGSVQFFVNGVATGSPVPLTQVGLTNVANAMFTSSTLGNGLNVITATFTPAGGSNYVARIQADLSIEQLVTVVSTTTLTAQQGPVLLGTATSFLAGVPQQAGLPVPTGTFTFVNASTGAVLGTAPVDATGRAVFTGTFPAGTTSIRADYSGDSFYRASSSPVVTQVVERLNRTVVGSDAGPITTVQVYDPRTGALLNEFRPFDLYTGGVKVATGDVNGDGIADIVVSAGAGAPGGHVKVYSGADYSLIASFLTFPGYTGGVNIAAGDVDGDGFADVVVGTAIANDHVKVFSGRALLATGSADASTIMSFFAYGGGNPVGVTVGTGDVDGDGRADVITGSALSAGHVKVFQAQTGLLIGSYFAYGAGYLGGIFVAGGDINGDGRAEIITGATNAPHVKALTQSGQELASFFAYLSPNGSPAPFGVRVGAVDRNGDGFADILTGSGGGAPAVKAFSGLDPSLLIESFIANPAGQAPSTSGVFVGGSTK